jgi:hypothetical protein
MCSFLTYREVLQLYLLMTSCSRPCPWLMIDNWLLDNGPKLTLRVHRNFITRNIDVEFAIAAPLHCAYNAYTIIVPTYKLTYKSSSLNIDTCCMSARHTSIQLQDLRQNYCVNANVLVYIIY